MYYHLYSKSEKLRLWKKVLNQIENIAVAFCVLPSLQSTTSIYQWVRMEVYCCEMHAAGAEENNLRKIIIVF